MKKLSVALIALLAGAAASADELYKASAEASYYADKFHGKKTASGETFNMYAFTAAHKTLPFNTIVKVTNLANGKSVNVRVNDRGPFVKGREIDVSKAAAEKLGIVGAGTATVSLEIVQSGEEGETETSAAPSATTTGATPTLTPTSPQRPQELAPNKRWDIQLGAFSKRENAEAKAQALVDAGFKNVVFQRTSEVTRVVIKDIPTEDVQETLDELERKGFPDYFVRERKKAKNTAFDAK